jgi:hypothetical protein
MSKKIILNEDQQRFVIEMFKTTPDLRVITQKLFENETLDGRSQEGRAVREFLSKENLKYKTSVQERAGEVSLSKSDKEFLMSDSVKGGMSALEIARLVFKDGSIPSLSMKHRCVVDFLKNFRPDVSNANEIITKESWGPPNTIKKALKKVNQWCGVALIEETLPRKQHKLMEQLINHLRSPRFHHFINQYTTVADRNLFESEFVRAVWDKPDLTNDELNLYVTVCTNYVRQKHIQARIDKLNTLLNDSDSERDVTMRLTELIKATSEELNQCEKRIESLTKDLNGSRQVRLKAKGEENGSIFALVEAFTDKEERDRMVMMAELSNKLTEEEADRLESMDDYKARVLGISKRELL